MRVPSSPFAARLTLAATAMLAVCAGPAVARQTPPPAPTHSCSAAQPAEPGHISDPQWARRPTPRYPPLAEAAGITGRVDLSCGIRPDGTLENCIVVEESPGGAGFADATLAVALSARLSPRSVQSIVPGDRVMFTAQFR